MPFPTINDSAVTTMRGASWSGAQYVSYCPMTIVFRDTPAAAITSTRYAAIDTSGSPTMGTLADIEIGQTVIVTTSTGDPVYTTRVRKAPSGDTLYIGEVGRGIGATDLITVYDDYRIWNKQPRWDEDNDEQLNDWDITFSPPGGIINNLATAYAGFVNASDVFEVAFAPQILQVETGVSTYTYLWSIPTGGTITAGTTTTKNITVEFDPGFYWVTLEITENNGRVSRRHCAVFAHDDSVYPVPTGFNGATITGDIESGYNATVSAFDGVDSLLDNTFVCIWTDQRYAGVETSVNGTVDFVGRIRTINAGVESDAIYSAVKSDVSYECEGPLTQLARIQVDKQTFIDTSPATKWQEISGLTVDRAALYVAYELTTFAELHGLEARALTLDTTYATDRPGSQAGSALLAINDLLQEINAALEQSADGQVRFRRDARMVNRTNVAITASAEFDKRDTISLTISENEVDIVGTVQAEGAQYNTLDKTTTGLLSIAPGQARGEGESVITLARQVLESSVYVASGIVDLNVRAGQMLARENDRVDLSMRMPDTYHPLAPSRRTAYRWILDSDTNAAGIVYDDTNEITNNWLLTGITHVHDNAAGTRSVDCEWTLVTIGTAGVQYIPRTAPQIPTTPGGITQPTFGPINPPGPLPVPPELIPAIGGTITPSPQPVPTAAQDGSAVAVWDDTAVYLSTDYLRTNPTYADISPTFADGETPIAVCRNPGADDFAAVMLTNISTTDSRVWYTNNILSGAGAWEVGESFPGTYDTIRVASNGTDVYVRAWDTGGTTTFCQEWDFSAGPAEWTIVSGIYPGPDDGVIEQSPIEITLSFSGARRLTEFSVTVVGAPSASGGTVTLYATTGSGEQTLDTFPTTTGLKQWTGSVTGVLSLRVLATRPFNFGLSAAKIAGEGTNPVGTNTCSVVIGAQAYRYSDDTGATFGAAQSLGAVFGAFAGMDTIKIGDPVLYGQAGQVAIEDAPGDGLANYGTAMPTGANPSCIVLPRRRVNDTDNTESTAPDFFVFSETPDTTDDDTLWAVTNIATTYTAITPTDGVNPGTAVSQNALASAWDSASVLAVIASVDGTRTLLTTTNGGSSWADRGDLGTAANFIRMRRTSTGTPQQLFYVDDDPYYSPDGGATLTVKTNPSESALTGIEVFG